MAPPESHVAGMIPVPGPRYPQGGPAVGNLPSHLPLPELSALAGPNGPNEYRLLDPNSRCHTSKKKGVLGVSAISMYYLRMKCIWFLYISLIYIYISVCLFAQSLFKENAQRHEQTHDIHTHTYEMYISVISEATIHNPEKIYDISRCILNHYMICIKIYTKQHVSC